MNRLHRATRNGAWLSAVPHRLNGTDLSLEEFRDNILLIYGLMHQDIPATCDGCGKRFSINNAPSFQKGGFVLARHDDAAKEWCGIVIFMQFLKQPKNDYNLEDYQEIHYYLYSG